MPLYEYECTACKRHTEKIQKFSDPEITICPYCGGELKRVITAPAFALKGGGWYADGYGSAKPAASDSDKTGSSSKPESTNGDASSTPAPAAATTAAAPAAPASAPAASSDKK